jgi:hypothetical protein
MAQQNLLNLYVIAVSRSSMKFNTLKYVAKLHVAYTL